MSLSYECCVLSGREVSVTGHSPTERSRAVRARARVCVSECCPETSIMRRRSWPSRDCQGMGGEEVARRWSKDRNA